MHEALSIGSPSQAEDVGLFMQCRSLMVIAQGDVELHADHSPQSDQPIVPETPGVVVVVVVVVIVVLIASLLIDCFLPVFLYIPVTVQPF